MSRFEFAVAERADDADLRALMAATPSGGKVSVSFRREPSYFDAAVVEGEFRQTLVAKDREHGRVVALGNRSARQRFVNGVAKPIGFLSNLRILPDYRSLSILARGYRHLRHLHKDGRTLLYLTTIAEGNEAALSTLTSGRAGLPKYHYAGDYHTAVIPLGKLGPFPKGEEIQIRQATANDFFTVLEFFDIVGPRRQFFPLYSGKDFFNPSGTFRNMAAEDILLAFRGSEIVGALACWNQLGFRQTIVESYGAGISWVRPLVNGWATLRGGVTLPKVGAPLRFVSAALPLTKDDDPEIFAALLQAACARANDGAEYLLLGLHERDPLSAVAARYRSAVYTARLYYVCWEDGESLRQTVDDRPPYLELGCL